MKRYRRLRMGTVPFCPANLLGCVLTAIIGSGIATAQDDADPGPLDGAWSDVLQSATRYLRQGRREAARTRFEEVLAGIDEEYEEDRPSPTERALAKVGLARIAREFGKYDDAVARAEEARTLALLPEVDLESALSATCVGDYDAALGAYDRILEKAEPASELGVEARTRRARLWLRTGKRDQAKAAFEAVVAQFENEQWTDPRRKHFTAVAFAELGGADRLYEASRLFIEVTKADPLFADAYVERGNLLFRVYHEAAGLPSGESEYKRALENCGEQEHALVALYRTRKENFLLESDKTDEYLRRALAVNRSSVPALVARAGGLIDERRFGAARSILQQALAVNPRDVSALAEMAAACNLLYREQDEKVFRDRAKAVDASTVEPDAVLGNHLVALYRFADAIPILQRARAGDADHVRAMLALGRALIYAGRAEEGAALLAKTKELERGFVNPWRDNQLMLQERVDETYEKVEIGNFVFQIHPSEKDVLVPYLSREYEEARKVLGTKYGTTPDCKVQVENFRRFGDFSVRTVGFKGFGALGACFGCLITSVSPAAPELRSQFSWKVTAWHEFAHVLHLQLSRARVPRWLTEGAAVAEEIALDPSYDRRMEREVYSALVLDRVIGVDELNKVFGGSQILLGYYQGGLICRHISERWGFAKVVDIIKAYGEDLSTAQIFERELEMGPDEYDAAFRDWLRGRMGSYAIVPTIDEEALVALLERAARQPDDVTTRLRLAQGFEQRGNLIDTGAQLAALSKIDPDNGDVLLLRAKMAARRKDLQAARDYLREGFAKGGDDFDSRMLYGTILGTAGKTQEAIDEFGRAIACWPTCSISGDSSPFMRRMALFKESGNDEAAIDELVRYAEIVGKDYQAQVLLAAHWHEKGEVEREVVCLERARDIDPFDRALHERLAEIYTAKARPADAAFCLGIAIAVHGDLDRNRRASGDNVMAGAGGSAASKTPGDERAEVARLRVLHAEALRAAGRDVEARDEADRALRDADLLDSSLVERAKEAARDR
ncbi:MAG: tetratricopeptide repeat protein [Planctomycetes bacterium]|nr:tetratricopeptide repeat protein [Planctomycetota bacterium]